MTNEFNSHKAVSDLAKGLKVSKSDIETWMFGGSSEVHNKVMTSISLLAGYNETITQDQYEDGELIQGLSELIDFNLYDLMKYMEEG